MPRWENNLANLSPRFVRPPGDPAQTADFSLKRDSPAWKFSFHLIPVEKIGLCHDELRAGLPVLKPEH